MGRGRGRARIASRPSSALGEERTSSEKGSDESNDSTPDTAPDAPIDAPDFTDAPAAASPKQGARSPPVVRVWSRTASPPLVDRPGSSDRASLDAASRPPPQLRPKSTAARLGPVTGAPRSEAPSPPKVEAPIPGKQRSGSIALGSPRRVNAEAQQPEPAAAPAPVPAATVIPSSLGESMSGIGMSPNLSIKTLQRLSKRLSSAENDKRLRNDTIRSLDTRIAEALLAGNDEMGQPQQQPQQQQESAENETNDQVWVWGSTGAGIISHPVPQALPDLGSKNVKCVCAGYKHMVMVVENGTVYTWGVGSDGRLGQGRNDVNQPLPTRVEALADKTIKTVAAGGSCSLALTHEGVCYFWGWLGVEEGMRFVTPVVVEGLEKQRVTAVAAGESHAMVLTMDHQVMSWGLNKFGR